MKRLPKIPKFLERKIYKTGQTRGADDDQVYQNRVSRNSTVLIPYAIWESEPSVQTVHYENNLIVLISPEKYLRAKNQIELEGKLVLGRNLLVFYEQRNDWVNHASITRFQRA